MSQFRLICNFKQCRKTLLSSAYVTTCSHVFCNEHGLNISTEQEMLICPVCETHFQTQQDIIRVNLNPNEVSKSVLMAGLSPELIMDIATRALAFWGYQVCEENAYLEAGLKTANENVSVLGAYCENSHAKYKSEINSLERKIDSLNEELEMNKKRCQDLIQQLQEKGKLINKLQINALRKGSSATMSATGGIMKQEDSQNYYDPKPTSGSQPAFHRPNPPNTFHRVSKPEQLSNFHMFPKHNQNNDFKLKPKPIHPPQSMHSFQRQNMDQDFHFHPKDNSLVSLFKFSE